MQGLHATWDSLLQLHVTVVMVLQPFGGMCWECTMLRLLEALQQGGTENCICNPHQLVRNTDSATQMAWQPQKVR